MHDIVWMLNPKNDTREMLIRRMKDDAGRLLREIPYDFHAPIDALPPSMDLELKRHLFLIYKVELMQNYPNPFNPSTTIKFTLPREVDVNLSVFNILGQLVGKLVNEHMKAGSHLIRLDANQYASGTYFYRITAGDFVQTKKMLVVK